jgi:hypothetical protein
MLYHGVTFPDPVFTFSLRYYTHIHTCAHSIFGELAISTVEQFLVSTEPLLFSVVTPLKFSLHKQNSRIWRMKIELI